MLYFVIICVQSLSIRQTMTTSTTPTSQYNNTFNNNKSNNSNAIQSNSYSNYVCGVYNHRIIFDTPSTTTTSTTFPSLTTQTVSSRNTNDLFMPPKVQMLNALPSLKADLFLNDSGLFTVYHFIKNFIGASGASAVAIDNKIEQAMDLVKSHLMFAVREEVEVLKEKISELMDRINQLEVENKILKANASQETLTKLTTAAPTRTTHTATNADPSNGPIS